MKRLLIICILILVAATYLPTAIKSVECSKTIRVVAHPHTGPIYYFCYVELP